RREREGRPLLGVLHRAGAVVVVAHLHLDHALELRGILTGLARALLERGEERVLVELGAFPARDDDPVTLTSREGRRLRPARRDEDRDRVRRLVEELRFFRVEVLPFEG